MRIYSLFKTYRYRFDFVLAGILLLSTCVQAQKATPTEARLLLGGNFPDPTILRYNNKYYMTHTSYNYRPGLLIWESDDLKNWKPLTYALHNFEGNVWAPELIEHKGRFYIYFPSAVNGKYENFVIIADKIEGPWSEAKPLGVGHIDPGHVVAEDGKRYVHLSAGNMVELSDDGLKAIAPPRKVHQGWPIPQDWAIECFCLESPKFTHYKGWYYLTAAQGGTFGPSTSHMATSFRSKSPLGPWESSPYNPIIRTWSRGENWWSKGHGTLVEAPDGQWFMVLHGIPNGYRTLGRATLIEPVSWDKNGWFKVADKWPKGWESFAANLPLSDEFDGQKVGLQWQFHEKDDSKRLKLENGRLSLQCKGESPASSQPLTLIPRDEAYEIETEVEVSGNARVGMMFFVSENEYMGISVDAQGQIRREQKGYKYYKATEEPKLKPGRIGLKIVNEHQDVRFYVRQPGEEWKIMQPGVEISQNGIARAALYVYGDGEGKFDYFRYTLNGKK